MPLSHNDSSFEGNTRFVSHMLVLVLQIKRAVV